MSIINTQIVAQNILISFCYISSMMSDNQQNITEIALSYLNELQKVKKFICSTKIVGQNGHFLNLEDFVEFMKEPLNYQWNKEQTILKLKWKINAINYIREHCIILKFNQEQLNERQLMQAQNKILKKQLEYFKVRLDKQIRLDQPINQPKRNSSKNNILQDQKIVVQATKDENPNNKKNEDSQSKPLTLQNQSKSTKPIIGRPKGSKSSKLPILLKDRIQFIKKTQMNEKLNKKAKLRLQNLTTKTQLKIRSKADIKKTKKIKKTNIKPKIKQAQKKNKALKSKTHKNTYIRKADRDFIKMQEKDSNSESSFDQNEQLQTREPIKNLVQISRKLLHDNVYQIKYKNRTRYEGQIRNNKFHGQGTFYTKNYDHQGYWKNGQTFGQGSTHYRDGGIQTGIYRSGFKRHGLGQDKYKNGQSYIGNFINQKKNGYGTYYFNDNQYYQGQWKNDLQHGKGIQYLKDGTRIQGRWYQDQKHGQFINYTKIGKIKQNWQHGELINQFVVVDQ